MLLIIIELLNPIIYTSLIIPIGTALTVRKN